MKKDFMKGVIVGGLIFGSIGAFAVTTFTALQASFPVFVNGSLWEDDKPAVVIDGSTYLPLRAIGDVLGVGVFWNESEHKVEVGEYSISLTYEEMRERLILMNLSRERGDEEKHGYRVIKLKKDEETGVVSIISGHYINGELKEIVDFEVDSANIQYDPESLGDLYIGYDDEMRISTKYLGMVVDDVNLD